MLPVAVIEDLPFYMAWVDDYADGGQRVRVIYSELEGEQPDEILKSISIHWRPITAPISEELIWLNFNLPQNLRSVSVRGQSGYTFWQPSNTDGNSAWLIWNEGDRTYMISFYGDWPGPTEEDPHPVDDLMLLVAESLNEP
jgi:hypothetical protein